MKNIHILTLIAILTITFSACRKDRGPKAFGFVLASGTNAPIEGANVDLYKGDSFLGPWTLANTLTTGRDGAYEFVIPDNEVYRLSSYHPKYFDVSNGYFQLSRDDRESNATLTPHAYIKLHVENVAPVNQWDILYVGLASGETNSLAEYQGTSVNRDEAFQVRGNRIQHLAYRVIKDGNTTVVNDSIYIPGLDTTFYEILY